MKKKRPRAFLLLLNGELREPKAVKALARRADAVLCADGGARHARALKLVPDCVVGDMDSLPRPRPGGGAGAAGGGGGGPGGGAAGGGGAGAGGRAAGGRA